MSKKGSIPSAKVLPEFADDVLRQAVMLRGARYKANMTQAQLVAKLGIPLPQLSEMENGKQPIDEAMSKRLAKVLDCDYRTFLGTGADQKYHAWNEKCKMQQFRKNLVRHKIKLLISTIQELELTTHNVVKFYLGKPAQPSFSVIMRKIEALAKSLKKASAAMEGIGDLGAMFLGASSFAERDASSFDPRLHIEYLERMTRLAERAFVEAKKYNKSQQLDKGGRPKYEALESLVVVLMDRFQEMLSIRPKHTVNPDNGEGHSLFDLYLKEALKLFAPPGMTFKSRRVDEVISKHLPSRDNEMFTPPRIEDE